MADKLRKVVAGNATTLSGDIGLNDTTIPLASTANWTRDTQVDIAIDRIDPVSKQLTPDKLEIVTITVDDTGGLNAARGVGGTRQIHTTGAVVEPSIQSAAGQNDEIDTLLGVFNTDGTQKAKAIKPGSVDFASGSGIIGPEQLNFPLITDMYYAPDVPYLEVRLSSNLPAGVGMLIHPLDNSAEGISGSWDYTYPNNPVFTPDNPDDMNNDWVLTFQEAS